MLATISIVESFMFPPSLLPIKTPAELGAFGFNPVYDVIVIVPAPLRV